VLDVDPAPLPAVAAVDGGKVADRAADTAGRSLDDVQRSHIISVLRSTGGVVEGAQGAAMVLGLHPNTLRSRLKKLGIPASTYKSPPQA
jgi:transcriptional regulator with GAF, ATPase, and Fis domain